MKRKHFFAVCAAILVLHTLLILLFGLKKEGFHEDEYYTYFTSAGNSQVYPYDDSIWELRGYDVQRQFLVTDEQKFDFKTVARIQESDVHPPLYYLTLHLTMSLFANRFYKWFGIALNALYSLITCCGVLFFFCHADRGRHRWFLAGMAGLVYAVQPSVISNVMLTRMYAMSAMWTVLSADVFVILMTNLKCSRRKFAGITICGSLVCYLMFLTHYFCAFMAFFLTLGYCILTLVRREGIVRMLIYGASQTAAIGLAVLTYPASLDQIFSGYRGEGALGGLFGAGQFELLKLFAPIINKNFFAGLMAPVLVLLAVALIADAIWLIRHKNTVSLLSPSIIAVLLTAGMLSVWMLSKTALLLGDASSRYFYPVGAVMLPLIAYCFCKTALHFLPENWVKIPICAVLAAIMLLPATVGFAQKNVLFLYSDEKEKIQFSRENAQCPAVVVYDSSMRHRSWFIADQLWPFEHVIYMNNQEDAISDNNTLHTAEKLIVYITGSEDMLKKIVEQNNNLNTYTPLGSDGFFAVFLLK